MSTNAAATFSKAICLPDMKRWLRACADSGRYLVLSLLLLTGSLAHAAEQAQLEAAYLVNFLRYTAWPDAAEGEPLVIVLLGREAEIATLRDAVGSAPPVQGRPLELRLVALPRSHSDDAAAVLYRQVVGADAVYLRSEEAKWGSWLGQLPEGHLVLTVGLGAGFVDQGGMLSLYREGNRLVFAANPQAVARSGLQVSSKVLQLARNLKQPF